MGYLHKTTALNKKNSLLAVITGTIFFFCAAVFATDYVYDEDVTIGSSTFPGLFLNDGDYALFHKDAELIDGGILFAETSASAVFERNVGATGGSLLILDSESTASFGGNVTFDGGAYAMFRLDTHVDWTENSKLSLSGTDFQLTNFTAFLNNLDTDIEVSEGGYLWLGGFLGTGSSILAYPTYYYTEDELGEKTWLKQEATRDSIRSAAKEGNVYQKQLSGDGELVNVAFAQYELANQKVDDVPAAQWASVFKTDQTGFFGKTNIISGNLVLSGNTTFGRDGTSGVTTVSGQRFELNTDETDPNEGKYQVASYGGLAFARNGIDDSGEFSWSLPGESGPTLQTGGLYLLSGRYAPGAGVSERDITGGARLWFDTLAGNGSGGFDSVSDRTIGQIDTARAVIFDDLQVYYDGISTLTAGAAVLNLDADVCMVVSADDPGDLSTAVTIDDGNTELLAELFEKPLVNVDLEKTGTNYAIHAQAVSAEEYAQTNGLDEKTVEIARGVDEVRSNLAQAGTTLGIYEALYNESDAAKVDQTFRNLGRGYGVENVFNLASHIGSVGSPFSMGGISTGGMTGAATAVSGMIQRGQVPEMPTDATTPPERAEPPQTSAIAPESTPGPSRRFWGAPFYTSISNDGNDDQDGYDVKRTGLMLGCQKQFSDEISGGYFFLYAVPTLTQSGQLEGFVDRYSSETKMNDFQFALHGERRWSNKTMLALQVSGGTQSVDWERTASGSLEKVFSAESTGNTLSANAYLSKEIELTDHLVWMPTVGVDSEHSWVFGFKESESGEGSWTEMTNLSQANFYSPYSYGRVQYSRNMARAGAAVQYVKNNGGFSGKAFYGTQLGGDDAALVSISSMADTFNADIEGVGMGRDSLNLGAGFWLNVKDLRAARIAANYDAIIYRGALTQTFVGTVNWAF